MSLDVTVKSVIETVGRGDQFFNGPQYWHGPIGAVLNDGEFWIDYISGDVWHWLRSGAWMWLNLWALTLCICKSRTSKFVKKSNRGRAAREEAGGHWVMLEEKMSETIEIWRAVWLIGLSIDGWPVAFVQNWPFDCSGKLWHLNYLTIDHFTEKIPTICLQWGHQ